MKCTYCGGEVGLEQKFCPYCGNVNEQAEQHYKDMASFRGRYADTEAEVTRRSDRYAKIIPRCVIIVVLLIATAAMYIFAENAYGLPELKRQRAAERDPEATISTLDAYLEEGDYIAFASYASFNGIRTYGTPFERYKHVYWGASYYKEIVLRLEKIFLQSERDDSMQYYASDDIRMLCQSLDYFMEIYDRGHDDPDTAAYAPYLEDMKDRTMELFHVYLGIDESIADEFLAMSDNRKAAYIEEVLLDAKSNS